MRKRKREESSSQELAVVTDNAVYTQKKAKIGEDALEKLLSLLSSEGGLVAGLTYFLTTIKHESTNEEKTANTKPLLDGYLERFPDCEHILTPLEWSKDKRTVEMLLLCFESLEQILLFTASCQTTTSTFVASTKAFRTVGTKLVHTMLSNHMRAIYSSLSTSIPMRLVASCLRLLVAMVMQGAESAREIQQVFNFSYKPLEVFPGRTHVIQGRTDSVRSCFINFALSFLVVGDSDVIKSILQLKGFLSSLFKLLPKDSSDTIHLFLTTLDQKVVQDSSIPKKTKSLFFNTFVLKQVAQLLTTPTDHAHNGSTDMQEFVYVFLVKLCTDFQLGICYKSKELPQGLLKTTNPVILNLLLSLTGSLSRPLVQTLVLKSLSTCPDIVLSYLSSLTTTFDPQPSSKWIANIGFITKLFTMLPSVSELLLCDGVPGCHGDQQLPLSYLDVGVGLTVPVVLTRSAFSLGVQHHLPVVKYHTLSLMKVALARAADLVRVWGKVKRSVSSIGSFLVSYCDCVLKSLPDVKTMISLHQQLLASPGGVAKGRGQEDTDVEGLDSSDRLRNAELSDCPDLLSLSLQVLQGYQTIFPAVFVQADYNLTKLLPDTHSKSWSGTVERCMDPAVLVPTLQLLMESPVSSLKWIQKGSTALHNVLMLTLNPSPDVAKMASALMHKLLVAMETFRGYDCEVSVVLLALGECHPPSFEDKSQVVDYVAKILLKATKEETKLPEAAKDEKMLPSEKEEHPSLATLLAGPLVIPEVQLSHDRHVIYDDHKTDSDGLFPLVHTLLSADSQEDGNLVKKFTDNLLRQLLLVSTSCLFDSLVLPHLGPSSEIIVDDETSFLSLLSRYVCLCEGVRGGVVLSLALDDKVKRHLLESFHELLADEQDFRCCVRAISSLLWRMRRDGVGEDVRTTVLFLFELLSEALSKMASCGMLQTTLNELFESRLIREAFLTLNVESTLHKQSTKVKRLSQRSSPQQPRSPMFSLCIGKLISTGVRLLPDLKSTEGVQIVRERLLTAVSEYMISSDSSLDDTLTKLLGDLSECIDSETTANFIESLLLSYKDIDHTSIAFLASLLELLLHTSSDVRQVGGGGRLVSSVVDSGAPRVCVSKQAFENLMKLAIKSKSIKLDGVIHSLLIHCISSPSEGDLCTIDSVEAGQESQDNFVSTINLLSTSLLSTNIHTSEDLMPHPSSPLSPPRAVVDVSSSVAQLLVTSTDSFVTDKLVEIYSCLGNSCSQNPRAKKVLESSRAYFSSTKEASSSSCKPHTSQDHTLSDELLTKLLQHWLRHPSTVSAQIVTVLLKISKVTLDYFQSSLLCELCEKLHPSASMDDDDSPCEEEQLCLWCVLSAYLQYLVAEGAVDSEHIEAVKMAGKAVWGVCVENVTDNKETAAICSTILCSLTTLLPKGMRKTEKLLLRWEKSSDSWNRHQLSLALSLPPDSLTHSRLSVVVMEMSLVTLRKLFVEVRDEGCLDEESILNGVIEYIMQCHSLPTVDMATNLDSTKLTKFIYTALKYRFTSSSVLKLLSQLVKLFHKPAAESSGCGLDIETLYERVWSHSKFLPIMCLSHDQHEAAAGSDVKECLVELLVTLIEVVPSLGRSSHVPVLLSAYSATRSKLDKGLLYLLFKYEEGGVSLSKYRPFLWGPAALEHYRQKQEVGWLLWKQPGMQEIVRQMKRDLLIESTNHFPVDTDLNPMNPFSDSGCGFDERSELYDPCFLLPLLTQQLDPSSLVDCRQFVDAGCLGYLIVSLSSMSERVRSLSGGGLELYAGHLEGSRFREKAQISLLMEVLKNSVKEKNCRLPSIFTAFFSATASLLLHADSPLYAVVSRFLVYKPALDLEEIPLLMTMLHSSSVEHVQERAWMLQLLVNGLCCKEDYSLYRKKRVFDHCVSLFGTGVIGKRCQVLILELILRGVALPEVAVDLLVNKGLMTSLKYIQSSVAIS